MKSKKHSICDNNFDIENEEHDKNKISEMKMPEQDVNHMEEVIIGMEQGTTFPIKIGTLMCNSF